MATNFKQLRKDGVVKHADIRSTELKNIHVEAGFNVIEDAALFLVQAEALADFLANGGDVPPIELRIGEDDLMYVVDGEKRVTAYRILVERGISQYEWVKFTPFDGDEMKRKDRLSETREGRLFTPIELSKLYQWYADKGLNSREIGERVKRSRGHVEQHLLLSKASDPIKEMVISGALKAGVAIEAVRQHGEQAEEVLTKKISGKKKISASDMTGKPLAIEIVNAMEQALAGFVRGLPEKAHEDIAAHGSGTTKPGTLVTIPAALLATLLKVQGDVYEARLEQQHRATRKANKAKQMSIDEE